MSKRCNHCKFYDKRHCNKKLCYRSPHNQACRKFKPKEEIKNMSNQIDSFNLELFDDGTIRLSFTGPFSVLKKILANCSSVDQFKDSLSIASKTKEAITDIDKVQGDAIVLTDPVKIDQLMGVTPLSSIELCDLVRIPVVAGDHYVFTDEDLENISKQTGVPFVICRNGMFVPIGWKPVK